MDKSFVNWGILSCARIAEKAVIPGIKNSNNSRLYAIAGKTKEKLEEFKARHNPVKAYDNYEEILNDPDVDAVYIPLPNSLHCEWTIKAAEKKKHVLCEKPLGCTPEEIVRMREACEKNGVLLMEAFAYRHNPLTLKLKELLDEQAIGKVKVIEAWFSFPLNDAKDIRLIKELGGGATYDVGCYPISLIRYLAGREPLSVIASGEVGKVSGVDESSCGILGFDDGLKGVFHCGFNAAYRCRYEILGEKGIICVSQGFNAEGELDILIKREDEEEVIPVHSPSNYMLEIEQFSRCILNGEKPLMSFEDSYYNAVVIDEVLRQVLAERV